MHESEAEAPLCARKMRYWETYWWASRKVKVLEKNRAFSRMLGSAKELLIDKKLNAGGKPSTKLPPGGPDEKDEA